MGESYTTKIILGDLSLEQTDIDIRTQELSHPVTTCKSFDASVDFKEMFQFEYL